MMNKKGNASRIILWCLFFIIIGFLIYSLVLTYKEIKKKDPSNENVTSAILDFAPRYAYDNEFQYSATSSISSVNMLFYDNTIFTDSNKTLRYNNLISSGYSVSYNGVNLIYGPSYTDNVLNIGNSYSSFYLYANDDTNPPRYESYFDVYTNMVIMYNCNILVSDFVLTNYSIVGGGNFSFALLYKTNSSPNFYVASVPVSSGTINDFSLADNLDIHVADATYITNFGLLFWTKTSTNANGICTFLNGVADPGVSYTSLLTFKIFDRDSSYQLGYEEGYLQGQLDLDNSLSNAYSDLVTENSSLSNEITNLKSRINQQSILISNLQAQIDSSNGGFRNLFFTFADIPFRTVSNALGFEFWGVNLFQFFIGIITALGIVWLIKKIL